MFQRSKQISENHYQYIQSSSYERSYRMMETPKKRKLDVTQKNSQNKTSRLLVSERLNNESYIHAPITTEYCQRIIQTPRNLSKKMSQLTNSRSMSNLSRINTNIIENNDFFNNRSRKNSFLSYSHVGEPRNCFRSLPRQQFIGTDSRVFIEINDNLNMDRPQDMHRFILEQQGIRIRPDAQFRKMSPTFIYQYAARNQQTKNNPIGYVQDGVHRNFSNMNNIGETYFVPHQNFLGVQNTPLNYDRKFAFETSNQMYESSISKGDTQMNRKASFKSTELNGQLENSAQKYSPSPFMEIQKNIPKQFYRNPQSSKFIGHKYGAKQQSQRYINGFL